MESKLSNKGFQLSVLGAVTMVIYGYIISLLVGIPFEILSESMYVNSHKVLEVVVGVLKDLIPQLVMIMVTLMIVREDNKSDFKIKYIEKFNLKLLLCTIFLMLGFFLWFHSSIGIILGKIPVSESTIEDFKEILQNPYLMVISSTIIAPIFEEIFVRGIILEGFLNKYKPVTAIILSSIIFGAIHLNIYQFINCTILGLIWGIIYYKTRSLVLCIVAHMVNNAIVTLCIVAYRVNNTMPILGVQPNIISFLVGAVIFIISGILFQRYIKKLKYVAVNSQENSVSSNG